MDHARREYQQRIWPPLLSQVSKKELCSSGSAGSKTHEIVLSEILRKWSKDAAFLRGSGPTGRGHVPNGNMASAFPVGTFCPEGRSITIEHTSDLSKHYSKEITILPPRKIKQIIAKTTALCPMFLAYRYRSTTPGQRHHSHEAVNVNDNSKTFLLEEMQDQPLTAQDLNPNCHARAAGTCDARKNAIKTGWYAILSPAIDRVNGDNARYCRFSKAPSSRACLCFQT